MREIKFRCWNKEAKSFHYWGVGIDDCTFIGPLSGKQPANKYEHQQFTGLRDQKGKEIYEGDILKTNENDIEQIGVVEYRGCAYIVNYQDTTDLLWLSVRYGEVVGNIHQHGELLNGE